MAALAHILFDLHHEIKGADVTQEIFTQHLLEEKGIIIESLNDMHYEDFDVIIVGNAFLNQFDFKNKKVVSYQEMVSYINEKYYSIAVCGTHGKTTTTNMIKHVLSSKYPIIYLVGDGQGKADENAKYFIYEACEHRKHFLNYHPNICVCTNIDYDHVDYYENKTQYKKAFKQFFKQCKDDLIISDTISQNNGIHFGLNHGEIVAKNVHYKENGIYFDLIYKQNIFNNLFLPFYGKHMLLDALACIACCLKLNMNLYEIMDSLVSYKGANRRYNLTFIHSNIIVDDYGHHPNEIKSTIQAIKQEFQNKKLYIFYHPDRPKRLTTFTKNYIQTFNLAAQTYVLPFLKMGEAEEYALRLIIDQQKIKMFNEEVLDTFNEKNCVFLFTGSKDMHQYIKRLIANLSNIY